MKLRTKFLIATGSSLFFALSSLAAQGYVYPTKRKGSEYYRQRCCPKVKKAEIPAASSQKAVPAPKKGPGLRGRAAPVGRFRPGPQALRQGGPEWPR